MRRRVRSVILVVSAVLAGFVLVFYLWYLSFPLVVLIVAEEATPGWAFVEFRSDCPSAFTGGEVITYETNHRGYACTSTRQPRWFRRKIRIRDSQTGKLTKYPGDIVRGNWAALNYQTCHDGEKTVFLEKFIGTSAEEAALRPLRWEYEKRAGIACAPLAPSAAAAGADEGR